MIESISTPERYFVTTAGNALASNGPCILRAILDSPPNCYDPLQRMPGHAKAIWGSVFHSMLDEIRRGGHRDGDLVEIMTQGIDARLRQQSEGGTPWRDIDLGTTSNMVELRRRCNRLHDVRESVHDGGQPPSPPSVVDSGATGPPPSLRTRGREVYVSGLGQRLTGLIDEVCVQGSTVTIYDDKTGKLHTESGEIKPSYIEQVRIYAALYEANGWGTVSRVALRDKSLREVWGEPAHQFDLPGIIERLEEFVTNSDDAANSGDLDALASPTCENCSMCPYRIVCPPHHSVMANEECNPPHPRLYIGNLLRNSEIVGTGKHKLTIEIGGERMQAEVRSEWLDPRVEINEGIALHAYYPNQQSPRLLVPRQHSHAVVRYEA